jgi:hypothetical protein
MEDNGYMTSANPWSIPEADPEEMVPPDPIGYNLDGETLLLHTVQTFDAVNELFKAGALTPDPRLVDPYNREAYEWMGRQMALRLPTRGDGILWLWAQATHEKLVRFCGSAPGQVLLTCRVPRGRVLVSNYKGWNAVTDRIPAPGPPVPGESENVARARQTAASDSMAARLRDAGVAHTAPLTDWPADLRAEIEQSWERIFDRDYHGPCEELQATVHMLHADDVMCKARIAR